MTVDGLFAYLRKGVNLKPGHDMYTGLQYTDRDRSCEVRMVLVQQSRDMIAAS